MKLDMLLYGLEDTDTTEIEGTQYELIATGNDSELDGVVLVRDGSGKEYALYAIETKPVKMLCLAETLRAVFDEIRSEGYRISWDERRAEADELIDEYATSENTPDLYAEAIMDLEADGETDTSEMRREFEAVFDMAVDDAV